MISFFLFYFYTLSTCSELITLTLTLESVNAVTSKPFIIIMGRRVEIKRSEDKSERQTSITNRRNGLVKKAGDYVTMFSGKVPFIGFSNASYCFGYGNPSVYFVVY